MAVPGEERDLPPGHLADHDRVAGRAERGLGLDLLAGCQQLVEARPADDGNARLAGHRLRLPSSRFRNGCRTSPLSSLAWPRPIRTCPAQTCPPRTPSLIQSPRACCAAYVAGRLVIPAEGRATSRTHWSWLSAGTLSSSSPS